MIFRSGVKSLPHVFNVGSDSPPSKAYLLFPILITLCLLLVQVFPTQAALPSWTAKRQLSRRAKQPVSVSFH